MSMLSTLDAAESALERVVEAPPERTWIDPIRDNGSTAAPIAGRRASRSPKLDCKIASSRDQWEAALGLVYRAYVRSGLIEANRHQMRVTPYHSLPTTEVLIAADQEEVVCTLSIVGDGLLGLPMESIYPEQVALRRRQGLRFAEVSCLANELEGSEQSFPVVSQLMALTTQCADYRLLDQLLIVVHPRHASFYERFLGFDVIGERRAYASVCDNPAIAMAVDLNRLKYDHPRTHRRMFRTPFAEEVLEYQPISADLRLDLRTIAAETYVDQTPAMACG
ncbi:MAG TPA: long-chain N-acyl amino acid synthase [Thermoguttaceae bacterium]|nr:long-chain N-acyl amino acid synthase [Thermoguttaceae bacterium]